MTTIAGLPNMHYLLSIFTWRRIRLTLLMATVLGLLQSLTSIAPTAMVVGRSWIVGMTAMIAFGVCEHFPQRLPYWLARWVLQLIGVVAVVPVAAYIAYFVTTGDLTFWSNPLRLNGYTGLSFAGILFAPWIALGAMIRQREMFVRSQAHSFALQKSELERKALDARMHLLQAQIQPHFLFNTLANIQALVIAGSPDAPKILGTLIAYLRAAVPRLQDPVTTLDQELQLVRAYLELMHMRMPDRLNYAVQVEEAALSLRCPPMTLMTLVENAVRHGIDPSEEGGIIEISVRSQGERCQISVRDTGVGLRQGQGSLGTGLKALRERLQLTFDDDISVRVSEIEPHGVIVEINFPARKYIP